MKAIVQKMKRKVVRMTPERLLLLYHFLYALYALVRYRHPSRHLTVLGVTGTKGKTTTSLFLHAALTAGGEKVGLLSTVAVHIGEKVYPNTLHLTTPGRGYVQKKLREMVDAGCSYAVLEISSEGIRQFRDFGIWYDSVVFTNLSPEHLVTHKTFEHYRSEKGKLFRRHAKQKRKYQKGVPVPRFALLNGDDEHTNFFSTLSRSENSETVTVGVSDTVSLRAVVERTSPPVSFRFMEGVYSLPFIGTLNVYNALPSIFLAKQYTNVTDEALNNAFASVLLPGRMEAIQEGQSFRVFCDYAHEPLSIRSVCSAVRGEGRVLVLVGAVGGGRWRYNAEEIGETAARCADVIVVTDVDPFFDPPEQIMQAVVAGVKRANTSATLIEEIDRRVAIARILSEARPEDTVVITGKGAELTMEVKGKSLPWDERAIVREELRVLLAR